MKYILLLLSVLMFSSLTIKAKEQNTQKTYSELLSDKFKSIKQSTQKADDKKITDFLFDQLKEIRGKRWSKEFPNMSARSHNWRYAVENGYAQSEGKYYISPKPLELSTLFSKIEFELLLNGQQNKNKLTELVTYIYINGRHKIKSFENAIGITTRIDDEIKEYENKSVEPSHTKETLKGKIESNNTKCITSLEFDSYEDVYVKFYHCVTAMNYEEFIKKMKEEKIIN